MLAVFIVNFTQAQTDFGSEKELRKQAENYFKDDKHSEALPLFSQLLSLYPKDPNYNYKYGVCLLFAKADKEKPLAYLTFALGKEGVDDDIYYYLGKAYHLNYRFDDAIVQYQLFKQKKSRSSTKLEVDLQIKQCENGKLLLKNITDLTVIDRKEMNSSEYFRAYDLTQIGAKLVVKPDELKTPFDIKKKEQSNVVIRQTSQEIYFSSYGNDGKNGRDIYKVTKLPNFTWGKPENIGAIVNTPYDEDFPYITPDGKTLYFCSKGHNSMGGYDVFRSELQPSGAWGKPQNLDFAINTPDDDIQFVTEAESDFAYFSSKRNSPEGKITVFKIRTVRVPVTIAAISGKFYNDDDPKSKKAKISIRNIQTGKFLGVFASSEKDGAYRLNLNNGTKYEYTVEQPGLPPLTQTVEIPPLKELRPLKQEIHLKKNDGSASMVIYNFFSDTLENNALATAELFKEKANLEVNYEEQIQAGIITEAMTKSPPVVDNKVLSNRNAYQESTDSSNEVKDTSNSLANNHITNQVTTDKKTSITKEPNSENKNNKTSKTGINNNELLAIAFEDTKDTQKEADDLRDKSRQAYSFAHIKNNAALKKQKEAEDKEELAENRTNPKERQQQLEEADNLKKEAEPLRQQAVVAYNLAKSLESEADSKQIEARQAEQYAQDLEKAIQSNSAEAILNLEKQNKELEKNDTTKKNSEYDNLMALADQKNNETQQKEQEKEKVKLQIEESLLEEKKTRELVLKTNDEKAKEQYDSRISAILVERKDKETTLTAIENEITRLKRETENITEEAQINKQILAEISSGNSTTYTQLGQAELKALDNHLGAEQQHKQTGSQVTQVSQKNTPNNSTPKEPITAPSLSKLEQPENYEIYKNSKDENQREKLLAEALMFNNRADSISDLLKTTSEVSENEALTIKQKQFENIAASKQVAAGIISYNILQKEYDANRDALLRKQKELQESDLANFNNSLSQIENDYQKAVDSKEAALAITNTKEQQEALNVTLNTQNVALVRQRQLLEQANSSIILNKGETKIAQDFKGFEKDRNINATEAVNSLRPDYLNYNSTVKLSPEEANELRKSKEFIEFSTLIKQAKTYEENADKKAISYNTIKEEGQNKIIESQQLIDLAAEEKKKAKKQAMVEEAVRIDNEGQNQLAMADTVKIQAQKEMLKAVAVKEEADKYIAAIEKERANKILALFNNQIEEKQVTETRTSSVESKEKEPLTVDITKTSQQTSSTNTNSTQQTIVTAPKSQETTPPETANQLKNNNNNSTPSDIQSVQIKTKDQILTEIKSDNDYKAYAQIKDESETLKKASQRKKLEADSARIQAEREAINSNDLFEFAAAQPKKKDRKEAQLKAEQLDKQAKETAFRADSLQNAATVMENQAQSKQNEADDFLRKFDEMKSKKLLMAYNNTVPEELLKTETPIIATKDINQNKETLISPDFQKSTQQKQDTLSVPTKPKQPSVKTTPEYNTYLSLKQETEKADETAKKWKQTVDSLKTLSDEKEDASNAKLEEVAGLNKKKRKPLVKEAADLDYQSQVLNRQADSLNTFVNEANKIAKEKKAAESSYINGLDKQLSLRIMRAIEGIPEPEERIDTSRILAHTPQNISTSSKESFVAPTKTSTSNVSFTTRGITGAQPHTARNPIKMNPQMPDGLVFKVQIGAFNRPVADNAFGTISPVTGETIAGSNLIRYTAGLFNNFNDAAEARKELNQLNYKDAFVVAYCYGVRISVSEARTLGAAGKDCKTNTLLTPDQKSELAAQFNTSTSSNLNSDLSKESLIRASQANINPPSQIKIGELLPQQDLETIKGLLYTVQVGVYSKPVKAGQLYNITPLYFELNQKGQYRYTSGIFNELKEALKAKDVIVQIGVSDAFVSAYVNGKRIPMEEAAAMELQKGKTVFAQVPGVNVQPKIIPMDNTAITSEITMQTSQTKETEILNKAANIVYKVQLGAFRKEVSVEIMNKFLSIADKGIANYKNGDLTIYTLGNFSSITDAEKLRAEVIALGITDAFIVAFNKGQKITIEEAKSMGGN